MTKGTTGIIVGGLVVLVATGATVGIVASHKSQERKADESQRITDVKEGPAMRVVAAGLSSTQRTIMLQGEARPYLSVTLFAKVSGYLKSIRVDKGDRVTKNQLLGVIESPELDEQLAGAKADARNRDAIAKRNDALVGPGVVSQQDAEQARANADVGKSTVDALAQQVAYKELRAPFDGVVTARYADPGALVQAATGAQSGALPLVVVAQADRLRIYVYIDQRDAPYVHVDDEALVHLVEPVGVTVKARVSRVSGELDPKTRMLLGEVDCDNKKGQIFPGSYVRVELHLHTTPLVQIPVEALVMRHEKPFVPLVAGDDTVTYRPVVVAGDDGTFARLASGLNVGDRVALSLGDSVVDGSHIHVMEQPAGAEAKTGR